MNEKNKIEDLDWYKEMVSARYRFATSKSTKENTQSAALIRQIEEDMLEGKVFEATAYDAFSLKEVINYLEKGHAYYLNKKLPEIEQSIAALVKHDDMDELLHRLLQHFFYAYKISLEEHIAFEEKTIFSYISYLLAVNNELDKEKLKLYLQGSDSLSDFVLHHSDTEKDLSKVLEVLAAYDYKFDGFTPYHLLMRQLSVLELDLSIHAKLEDEVLVPRAIKLENEVLRRCMNKY